MANSKQARKRVRQDEIRRRHNHGIRSAYRTHVKKFLRFIEQKEQENANNEIRVVESFLDKAVKRNTIHRGKASRIKSRLKSKLAGAFQ